MDDNKYIIFIKNTTKEMKSIKQSRVIIKEENGKMVMIKIEILE